MSRRSKNHHYVPKFLQKQFLAEGHSDKVWYSERSDENGSFCEPYLKHIDKAFYKSNFYTVSDADGELSDRVEREFYGKLDNYLGGILQSIISDLNDGKPPVFEGEPLCSLLQAVIDMLWRTPEAFEKYDDEELGRNCVAEALAELSQLPSDDPRNQERRETEVAQNDPDALKRMGREVRVRAATTEMSPEFRSVLSDFIPRWGVISTNHAYILSSSMIYFSGPLLNEKSCIFMPISPKHALLLCRDPKNEIPLRIDVASEKVRQINENAARKSKQIASHSQKLIESITRKKAVCVGPITGRVESSAER
ncbi:DUF4238 domain-containing protein [Hoeflea sp.]|uniref:DUF4238 domain-containing protein n=1 Tax=Hoeflea sp. TaxID=1940281 RepID=UPI003B02B750